MEKIFEQSKDLHIRNMVVYGKAGDHKLYAEPAFTNQVAQADIEEAFAKGMLIIDLGSGEKTIPVTQKANKVWTVGTSSSAVALIEWTAKATA